MHPIELFKQQSDLEKSETTPLWAMLVGHAKSLKETGGSRVVEFIKKGRLDADLNETAGSEDRPIVLMALGGADARLRNPDERVDAVNIAKALVARGGNPFACDNKGRDALDQAFAIGAVDLVSDWRGGLPDQSIPLLQRRAGVLVNSAISGGKPANSLPWLHHACLFGDTQAVSLCLAIGFDPNHVDGDNGPPLFWASDAAVVKQLIKSGADPHFRIDGMSVGAFWSGTRSISAGEIKPLLAALPRPRGPASRQDRINDFYAAAPVAAGSILRPLAAALQPGDVDDQGLGPIGVMGQRLGKHEKGTREFQGVENCSRMLLAVDGILDWASTDDWIQVMAGAFTSNGVEGVLANALPAHLQNNSDFWRGVAQTLIDRFPMEGPNNTTQYWSKSQAIGRAGNGMFLLFMGSTNHPEGEDQAGALLDGTMLLLGQSIGHLFDGISSRDASVTQARMASFFRLRNISQYAPNILKHPSAWKIALTIDKRRATQGAFIDLGFAGALIANGNMPGPEHRKDIERVLELLGDNKLRHKVIGTPEVVASIEACLMSMDTAHPSAATPKAGPRF